MKKASVLVLVLMLWATANSVASAQDWVWAPDFEVGDPIVPINAPDQNGQPRTLAELSGDKGLVRVLEAASGL